SALPFTIVMSLVGFVSLHWLLEPVTDILQLWGWIATPPM
ncbi:MAG TPA: hypothetical protein DCE46_11520, partial [Pantoea sp.]|nr:hypothetical protein [Pantoea sp.]